MGLGCFWWCLATEREATGSNWNTGSSICTWEKIASLWHWPSTGTVCLERWRSLFLCRCLKAAWMWSWAMCCRRRCLKQRDWTRWSQAVPSNLNISVIPRKRETILVQEISKGSPLTPMRTICTASRESGWVGCSPSSFLSTASSLNKNYFTVSITEPPA